MRTISVLVPILAVLVLACGEDSTSPENGGTPAGPVTITSAGGTITRSHENGARLTLEIPAGAVLEDTEFEIRALEPQSAEWARFELSPPVFLLQPARMSIRMPEDWTPGTRPRLQLDGSVLATSYHATTRTLSTSSHYLGYAPEDAKAEGSSELVAAELSCEDLSQSLQDKITAAQNLSGETVSLFKQIVQEFTSLATDCPGEAPSIPQIEAALQQIACAEYQAAVEDLQNGSPPSDALEIKAKVNRVVAAQGLKLETDATCGSAEEFLADIEPVFSAYVQGKQADYGDPEYVMELQTWDDLWQELKAVLAVAGQAGCFALTDVVALIQSEVMAPLMELFRDKAYRICFGSSGTQVFLGDLLTAGVLMDHAIGETLPLFVPFDAGDLSQDIQYCASQLDITLLDASGAVLETAQLLQDILDYEVDSEISLSVPADGSIELGGYIRALRCYDKPPFPDELHFQLASETLGNVKFDSFSPSSGGVLFESPYTLGVAELLEAQQLSAGDSFQLILRRVGTCDDFLGLDDPYTLFTLDIDTEGCAPADKSADGECLGFAQLDRLWAESSTEAYGQLFDENVELLVQLDQYVETPNGNTSNFFHTTDIDTSISVGALSRNIDVETTHSSVVTVVNGALVQFKVDIGVSASCSSIGYQSGSSDHAEVDVTANGKIDFDVFGAAVPASIAILVSGADSHSISSAVDAQIMFSGEGTTGTGSVDFPSVSGNYEVEFFAASGEAELQYAFRLKVDAQLGPDDEPGTASASRTISLIANFNP